ncbi:major histocompatibility complex class I-related gene protein-like [Paramisgurnus dabryanus]|uniref:major histocompatibility complex class I-related gene protein-like n=1 Tax=Paramisgurnus dabryanus TaxID=90735 RepID=UPI0031F47376
MLSVALLLPVIHLAFAGHSLQYFYTVVSGDINFPGFTVVGFVNDQEFIYFDSKIKKAVPKTEWIRENKGEDYWNRETNAFTNYYWEYKNEMQIIMDRFNHSEGVHTLQVMYGCELVNDGTTGGYWQYGYDGEDYINFDKTTLTHTAANPQAIITKNKWDANRALLEYRKTYLENTCIEWLRKYVSYGKNVLGRKDAPTVSLLQKDSSSPVVCHATGFYPSNIMMTWKKNQDDHNEDVEVSSTLSNADGSYQKSISLSVNPEEWKKNPDVYRCVVQNVGAKEEIVVLLNEKNIKSNSASDYSVLFVACGLGVLLLLLLPLAVYTFIIKHSLAKNKSLESTDFVKTCTSEKSDSASELLPQQVTTKRLPKLPPQNKLKKREKK